MAHATKMAIAIALKELMQSKPLSKITINDITGRCGINRMTFYYHFRDIYELIDWIFKEYIIIRLESRITYATWQDGMIELLNNILENKTAILNLYNSVGREQVQQSMQRMLKNIFENVINELSDGMAVSEKDKAFAVYYYDMAFSAVILDWIKQGMEEKPEDIARNLDRMLRGCVKLCLENMAADKKL